MTGRTIAWRAALVLGLLLLDLGLGSPPARACVGAQCRAAATAMPLDLMKFMRRQTAATRTMATRRVVDRPAAQVHHERRKAVARLSPAPLPVEAAAAFAAQDSNVQVVAGEEFNAIDRSAAAPVDTSGAAVTAEPDVQLVDANLFNDIDRKAADVRQPSAAISAPAIHAPRGHAGSSWIEAWVYWVWSALDGAFVALAAAARYFLG